MYARAKVVVPDRPQRSRHSFGRSTGMLRCIVPCSFVALSLVALGQEGDPKPVKTIEPYAASGSAQQVDTPGIDTARTVPGEVTIHQDEKITRLMEDYTTRKHILKGYRVQIYL